MLSTSELKHFWLEQGEGQVGSADFLEDISQPWQKCVGEEEDSWNPPPQVKLKLISIYWVTLFSETLKSYTLEWWHATRHLYNLFQKKNNGNTGEKEEYSVFNNQGARSSLISSFKPSCLSN